jgi:hypothetical protein
VAFTTHAAPTHLHQLLSPGIHSLLLLLLADPLPGTWFTGPGMSSMRAFMCQNCKWVMAADASYAAWQDLAYLDIGGNQLFALDNLGVPLTWLGNPTNVLPPEWQALNLSFLRVRAPAMLLCSAGRKLNALSSACRMHNMAVFLRHVAAIIHKLPKHWALNQTQQRRTRCGACFALQARGCNLTAATSTELATWTSITQNTGLINRIRMLDVGDNPELAFTDMEVFFGQLRLWEL